MFFHVFFRFFELEVSALLTVQAAESALPAGGRED